MEVYETKESEIPGIGDFTVAPNELPLKAGINVHHMAQIAFLRARSTDELSNILNAELSELLEIQFAVLVLVELSPAFVRMGRD